MNPDNAQNNSSAPPVPTPTITTPSIPVINETKKKSFILPIFIVFILMVLAGSSVFAYFVSQDKVSTKNPKIDYAIASFVGKLPFIPKTPKFILESMTLAHSKVSKNSFDISSTIASDQLTPILGSSSFDFQIKGYTNFEDLKDPKSKFNISVTKQLNVDILKPDKFVYFKINEIPSVLYAFLGENTTMLDSLKSKWISFDTSSLETPASKKMEEELSKKPKDDNTIFWEAFLKDNILPKITTEKETLDGINTYKMTFSPTPQDLDKIYEKLKDEISNEETAKTVLGATTLEYNKEAISDYIKEPKIEMWIDDKDYFVRQIDLFFKMHTDSEDSQDANVVLVLKLSDFGKDIEVTKPQESISSEEFYKQIGAMTAPAIDQYQKP